MAFRAIVFDLDGTLISSGEKQIRPATLAALKKARDQGITVTIASGRHHETIRAYHDQLELGEVACICCNGAYLYDFQNSRAFSQNVLSLDIAKKMLRLVRRYDDVFFSIYTMDVLAYERPFTHIESLIRWGEGLKPELRPRIEAVPSFEALLDAEPVISKFFLNPPDKLAMQDLEKEAVNELSLICEWSGDHALDIANAGNSKGNRLKDWAEIQGIALEEIVAFGDSYNDMDMLQNAGLGIAMAQADEPVKQCADLVAPGDNNTDAIADILHHYVLNN
jgi:HAD-superfamily hydrolase, subfamily IIB